MLEFKIITNEIYDVVMSIVGSYIYLSSIVLYVMKGQVVTYFIYAIIIFFQLGYHIYPSSLSPLRDAVKSAASHSYSCAPAPQQFAVAKVHTRTL